MKTEVLEMLSSAFWNDEETAAKNVLTKFRQLPQSNGQCPCHFVRVESQFSQAVQKTDVHTDWTTEIVGIQT